MLHEYRILYGDVGLWLSLFGALLFVTGIALAIIN